MESPQVRTDRASGSPFVASGAEDGSATGASADEPQGPQVHLTVAAVARRVGVAPATLRTWDRRYGLGPSAHAAGAHRRYSAEDVARLEAMRRLTHEGVAPAEAARVVRATPAAQLAQRLEPPAPARTARPGGPGGRVLALPGADATMRGLARAAMALDAQTVTATVRAQVEERGVVPTWDAVLRPVLRAVGARWATTGEGVEVEHLLADCVTGVLREVAGRAREQVGRRPVLLACAPDEQHALPLHALAAGLGERGLASRTLGPALPAAALHAALRRTGAAVLFLWSQRQDTAQASVLEELPRTRPATAVLVGGPGWVGTDLPRRVTLARDLPHAVALVDQALGA